MDACGQQHESVHARANEPETISSLFAWDAPRTASSAMLGFFQANTSSATLPSGQPLGWVSAASNGGRCTIEMVRRHRCRLVLELTSSLGFTPSSAALRASFEPSVGVARRSALLSPLVSCSRAYGVVVPAALAVDIERLYSPVARQLVTMRITLECEGMPGDHKHHNLWGSELLRAALVVDVEQASGATPSQELRPEPNADMDALLRSFWQESTVARRSSPKEQGQLPVATAAIPAARTTRAYVQVLPPRTGACGPRAASNRSAVELRMAAGAFYGRRLAWQRHHLAFPHLRLHPPPRPAARPAPPDAPCRTCRACSSRAPPRRRASSRSTWTASAGRRSRAAAPAARAGRCRAAPRLPPWRRPRAAAARCAGAPPQRGPGPAAR